MNSENSATQEFPKIIFAYMEKATSDFLLRTCRVRPKPNLHRSRALYYYINAGSLKTEEDTFSRIVYSTGSASEFYIEPLLSCIQDYDIMWHRDDKLAIPAEHSIPQSLPEEFRCEVQLHEFIDTQLPGFVLVAAVGQLIQCSSSRNYAYIPKKGGYAGKTNSRDDGESKVSAAEKRQDVCPGKRKYKANGDSSWLSVDLVYCIRCLVWPPQAAGWPSRSRESGWPDVPTINKVVSEGCHVVQTSHRHNRQDEWLNKRQWRLSFSTSETILLNSWSVEQQLVYHILRVYIRGIRPRNLKDFFHNYLIKTTMLWACELDPPTQWSASSLVNVSKNLLYRLAGYIKSSKLPMYFIREHNLLETSINVNDEGMTSLVSSLSSLTGEELSLWLIESYARQYAENGPSCISNVFFVGTGSSSTLTKALTTIAEWRQISLNEISYSDFQTIYTHIQQNVYSYFPPHNAHFMRNIVEKFSALNSDWLSFYLACCFLRAASMIERDSFDATLRDSLATLCHSAIGTLLHNVSVLQTHSSQTMFDVSIAEDRVVPYPVCWYFKAALALMQIARLSFNENSFLSQILVEISKRYLHTFVECARVECSYFHKRESTQNRQKAYLACLYFSSGQYRTASDYCLQVLVFPNKHDNEWIFVDRKFLPCFDTFFEITNGFALCYNFLKKLLLGLGGDGTENVVCSVDVLSLYLLYLCVRNYCGMLLIPTWNELHRKYKRCISNHTRNMSIADVILLYQVHKKANAIPKIQLPVYSIIHRCNITRVKKHPNKHNTVRLRRLLVQSAIKLLTDVRVSMSLDFKCLYTIATCDFQAMYAYKRGLFKECQRFCEEALIRLLNNYDNAGRTPVFDVKESDLLYAMNDKFLSLVGLARVCGLLGVTHVVFVDQFALLTWFLLLCRIRLSYPQHSLSEILQILLMNYHYYIHRKDGFVSLSMMVYGYSLTVRYLTRVTNLGCL